MLRNVTVGLVAIGVLTACGQDTAGPELGVDLGDIEEDAASFEGEDVLVSADVNEVLTPTAFTIAGTEDTTVEEFLVVAADSDVNLAADITVAVDGTVRLAFDPEAVEQELGIDLDEAVFEPWVGEPYLVAKSIDASVPSEE